MTDRIALWLGMILVAALVFDFAVNEGAALVFLARRLSGLVEYLVFWR